MIQPLAERFRPKSFDEYVGQKEKLRPIFQSIQQKKPRSTIFWGPPGCGKTTLARLYCKSFSLPTIAINATSTATQELRKCIDQTKSEPLLYRPTIVWIDEVHRLTRPQQDVLLSSLEDGSLILVAATTENPSFQLTGALLSRLQVLTLEPLKEGDLLQLLERVLASHPSCQLSDSAKKTLITWAGGDARSLLNMCEALIHIPCDTPIEAEDLAHHIHKKRSSIDPTGEGRYQLISALHKAVRGSDCQAALYWFSRQVVQGEDMRYIARRLIRMAVEDIGLADPEAVTRALDGLKAYETLGSPEGDLAIAQVVMYLALAPKSNCSYMAFKAAKSDAEKSTQLMPPKHIVNAPTKWMENEGFGEGYQYDHDLPDAFSGQNYFPLGFEPAEYYVPVERGFERELTKRIAYFSKLKESKSTINKS